MGGGTGSGEISGIICLQFPVKRRNTMNRIMGGRVTGIRDHHLMRWPLGAVQTEMLEEASLAIWPTTGFWKWANYIKDFCLNANKLTMVIATRFPNSPP